jgi:hypothetical protein
MDKAFYQKWMTSSTPSTQRVTDQAKAAYYAYRWMLDYTTTFTATFKEKNVMLPANIASIAHVSMKAWNIRAGLNLDKRHPAKKDEVQSWMEGDMTAFFALHPSTNEKWSYFPLEAPGKKQPAILCTVPAQSFSLQMQFNSKAMQKFVGVLGVKSRSSSLGRIGEDRLAELATEREVGSLKASKDKSDAALRHMKAKVAVLERWMKKHALQPPTAPKIKKAVLTCLEWEDTRKPGDAYSPPESGLGSEAEEVEDGPVHDEEPTE